MLSVSSSKTVPLDALQRGVLVTDLLLWSLSPMQSLVIPRSSLTDNPYHLYALGPSTERFYSYQKRPAYARGQDPRGHPSLRSMFPRIEEQPSRLKDARSPDSSKTSGAPRTEGSSEDIVAPAETCAAPTNWAGDQATVDHFASTAAKWRSSVSKSFARPKQLPPSEADQKASQKAERSISSEASFTAIRAEQKTRTPPPPLPKATERVLLQKSRRQPKAHVASACVNCKKKHLGCDSERPCRRCVATGKAETCVNVTHKKRGRPPLKVEETSTRTLAAPFDHPTSTLDLQQTRETRRVLGYRITTSREIRPMTDLLMSPAVTGSQNLRSATPSQPQSWSRSLIHLPDTSGGSLLSLQNPFDPTPRSCSAGSLAHMAAASQHAAYPHRASTFGPPSSGADLSLSAYSIHQPLSPNQFLPYQFRQPFSGPTSPTFTRDQLGRTDKPTLPGEELRTPNEAIGGRGRGGGRSRSPVQLPPLLPTMKTSSSGMHAHRLSDPYPAPWLYRSGPRNDPQSFPRLQPQQESRTPLFTAALQTQTDQPGPVSPLTRLNQPLWASNLVDPNPNPNPTPTHPTGSASAISSPILFSSSLTAATGVTGQRASVGGRAVAANDSAAAPAAPDQSGRPTETNDSRPTKRRKMALDEIVND